VESTPGQGFWLTENSCTCRETNPWPFNPETDYFLLRHSQSVQGCW